MSKNTINFTQAAAVGGMAVATQVLIQPTSFLGWAGAAAITAIGTKIIGKIGEKATCWWAHKTRNLQLNFFGISTSFQTVNKVEHPISEKEKATLKKYAQSYLEGKIGHLLPKDNENEKKEMLNFLVENFVSSVIFDAEFLGVCAGGSFAAAYYLSQSTLEEHPTKILNRLILQKKGWVLFHGLNRLTSADKNSWYPTSNSKAVRFFNNPNGLKIMNALADINTGMLDRGSTYAAAFSDFFGKEITLSMETLNQLALDPIYPWAAEVLKEFIEKHDGKAAVCIFTGKGDCQILHITFKNSFLGHAVAWYADAKTCSYFYLDLNGNFSAMLNAEDLARNMLHCISKKYGGVHPSVKEICLISPD